MRLRIAETVPGELLTRAVDAVRVIERLSGRTLLRDDLRKADKVEEQIKQSPAQFEYKVLEQAVKRGGKEVERIRKRMLERINEVLKD
jgi:hypothetical protein